MRPHPLTHVDAFAHVHDLTVQVLQQVHAWPGRQAGHLRLVDAAFAALFGDRLVLDAQQAGQAVDTAVGGGLDQVLQERQGGFGIGSGAVALNERKANESAQAVQPVAVQPWD